MVEASGWLDGWLDVAGVESSREDASCSVGVLLPEEVSASSGMVANCLRTCFRAGRRMGLLRK